MKAPQAVRAARPARPARPARAAALLLATAAGALLSGCVGYPRPFLTRIHGKAAPTDDGKPRKLAAAIVKECETWRGENEIRGRMHETTPDKDGRYSLTVMGMAWNFKNLITEGTCESHVQLFDCRPYCKKVDQIDVDVLGK